jgi:5-methyltetrahydrofolate--homocysteine methyltransferase
MIIIGELTNASRKAIDAILEARDAEAIQKVAREEVKAVADDTDINAGIFINEEPQYLKSLVETVQEVVDVPCY